MLGSVNMLVFIMPSQFSRGSEQDMLRPLVDDFSFGSSALIGLLVIAVAIATVIVISLVLLRKRQYGTISHGIVEVRQRSRRLIIHSYCFQFGLEDNYERTSTLLISMKDGIRLLVRTRSFKEKLLELGDCMNDKIHTDATKYRCHSDSDSVKSSVSYRGDKWPKNIWTN